MATQAPQTTPLPTGQMAKEPAVTVGAITTCLAAAIVLAKSFGLPLTIEQEAAINGFLAVFGPMAAALMIRQQVYSPHATAKLVNAAAETGQANVPAPPATDATDIDPAQPTDSTPPVTHPNQ